MPSERFAIMTTYMSKSVCSGLDASRCQNCYSCSKSFKAFQQKAQWPCGKCCCTAHLCLYLLLMQHPSLSATENKAPLLVYTCAFNDDDHHCGLDAQEGKYVDEKADMQEVSCQIFFEHKSWIHWCVCICDWGMSKGKLSTCHFKNRSYQPAWSWRFI